MGCSHVVVLATRPPFQGGRLKKAVADVLTGAVKRAVLNPAYMKQAWARELEMLAEVFAAWDVSQTFCMIGYEHLISHSLQGLNQFVGVHLEPLRRDSLGKVLSSSCAVTCLSTCLRSSGCQNTMVPDCFDGKHMVGVAFSWECACHIRECKISKCQTKTTHTFKLLLSVRMKRLLEVAYLEASRCPCFPPDVLPFDSEFPGPTGRTGFSLLPFKHTCHCCVIVGQNLQYHFGQSGYF